MKSFLTIAFSILLAFHAHAEPSPTIDGLAGIPFGSTAEQVKAAMDTRGAVLHRNLSTGAHMEFEGGSFSNEDADFWHFYFADGKLYKASVSLKPGNRQHLDTYERIKKLLEAKYGKPFQETKLEMEPAALYEMVRSGKAVLEADWKQATPSSRSIACKLFRRAENLVIIRIIYQDDAVESQVADKQKNDI